MPKASKLSEFERGRIVELHKQGLSQRAIAAEVHRSKTVICNFLKDSESYGAAKLSGRLKKNLLHWVEELHGLFLNTEVEAPLWCGVPFPTEEQRSFKLCRVVKQQLVKSACYKNHLWRRRTLVCVVMNGISSRIMQQFTLPATPLPAYRMESFFYVI